MTKKSTAIILSALVLASVSSNSPAHAFPNLSGLFKGAGAIGKATGSAAKVGGAASGAAKVGGAASGAAKAAGAGGAVAGAATKVGAGKAAAGAAAAAAAHDAATGGRAAGIAADAATAGEAAAAGKSAQGVSGVQKGVAPRQKGIAPGPGPKKSSINGSTKADKLEKVGDAVQNASNVAGAADDLGSDDDKDKKSTTKPMPRMNKTSGKGR